MSIASKLNTLKDKSGLTLEQIAEISNVPIGSVKRLFSGHTENPSFQTVADIVTAMGGSLDEFFEFSQGQEHTDDKRKTKEPPPPIQHNTDPLIELYRQTIAEKNRWIYTLFGILAILLVAVMVILIYDLLHPNMGYIQY